MFKNSKYIIVTLEERNGEYEYTHKSVHELVDERKVTANRYIRNWAKTFYGENTETGDGGYYFNDGEVFVKVYSWDYIGKEDYDILARYL